MTKTGRPAANATMLMLIVVSMFNYIDRTIISILQEPIKLELGLSDAQLGALTGLAFALFYATLSLPIARIADSFNRKYLIAASLFVWSAMTALCGFAESFLVLLFLRIGVAIGEAGSVPASHSVIADLFPVERRATALSMWGLALPFGILAGYAGSGWLTEWLGWRESFFVFGLAGIALVPIFLLVTKEPKRGQLDAQVEDQAAIPILRAVKILWDNRIARLIIIGASLHAFTQYSIMTWSAPFYIRVWDASVGEVATALALINGIGGGLGIYFGGWLSDRLAIRYPAARLWVSACAFCLFVLTCMAQLLVPSVIASYALGFFATGFMFCYYGPVVGTLQSLVHPRMRATASAVLLLVFNIVGLGLGPFLTGVWSDWLYDAGLADTSLRYALLLSLVGSVIAAWCWWRASRHLISQPEPSPLKA